LLAREHKPLGLAQRRVADCRGGVVGTDLLARENVRQLRRTFPQLILKYHVSLRIDKAQISTQPLLRCRLGNRPNFNPLAVTLRRGSVAEDQPHRFKDSSTADVWLSAPSHKKTFVYIEMKHAAECGDILAAQGPSDFLHHGIANSVGVPDTLALDQFDALLLDRHPIQGFDDDFRHGAQGRPTWRRDFPMS
jgi:hypothetical protein